MKIQQEKNTPHVNLDTDNCILTIKGASYPDHADIFYNPIFEHVKECLLKIKPINLTINLAMTLMNSVSEKCIFQIVKMLAAVNEVEINWYYEDDDEDMKEEGEIWESSLKNVKFNMYDVKDIDNILTFS